MAKYMFQARYTSEGAKGLVRDGATGRRAAVEKACVAAGGSLESMYYAFGGIDAYVEYTGTSLTAIFNQPAATDPEQVFATVRDRYASAGVTMLPRLGFNNTFAILVRGDAAQVRGLKTVSDLAREITRLSAS